MAKFKEAQARLFTNVFVCKRCSAKLRTQPLKVIERKVSCRKCSNDSFRPTRKK
jgi:ribosomal protein L40E